MAEDLPAMEHAGGGRVAGVGWRERGWFAVILLSYTPLLLLHLQRLWRAEFYRYFPLILVGVALLLWDRSRSHWMDERPAIEEKPQRWLAMGLACLAVAVLIWSPWLAAVSAIFTLRAMFGALRARKRTRFAAVWLLLLFLIPAPLGLDEQIHAEIQRWTTHGGSYLLDYLGQDHWLHGKTLYLLDRQVAVDRISGGIGFTLTLVAVAIGLMMWLRRPLRHSIPFVASAVLWAAIVDAVRVALVVRLMDRYDVDVAGGYWFVVLESGTLAAALVMLFCTDLVLLFLFLPPPGFDDEDMDEQGSETAAAATAGSSGGIDARGLGLMTWLFVALGVVQLLRVSGVWVRG
ncbi:MAG: exosortase/archaeosortase family protein [Pirellulaceae bacterium]